MSRGRPKKTTGGKAKTIERSKPSSARDAIWPVAAACVLALALWVVYGRGLNASLVFDDRTSVIENQSITKLWPLVGSDVPGPLNPPPGMPTAGRPLVNLTLALNYSYGNLDPWSYHVFNLIVHLLATLLVGLIIWRILELDFFAGRFSGVSGLLAFLTALLWGVHPLNTESVEYVTQRTELMVGLFYLATVYGSLKYWLAESQRGHRVWLGLTTAVSLAGVCSKEVMVTAPIMVVLLERTLIAGSFRATIRRSWPLYVGLAMSWMLLAVLNYGAPRSASAGFHLGLPATTWWLTQAKVLWMYFKLVVWPWPLLIHYSLPYVDSLSNGWPWVLATVFLVIGTILLVWQRWSAGLVGAWVLLILSPTLVVPIITEVAAERRMYLPLAGIVLLAVAGGYTVVLKALQWAGTVDHTFMRRAAAAVIAAVGIILAVAWGAVDVQHLAAFQDPVTLWQNTIDQGGADSFAYNNLGYELLNAHRTKEALEPLQKALKLDRNDPKIYTNLGMALDGLGQPQQAVEQFQEALKIDPGNTTAKRNLALSLAKLGQSKESLAELQSVVNSNPNSATAHYDLGIALGQAGRLQQAVEEFQRAIALRPDYPAAYNNSGVALMKLRRTDEAIQAFKTALTFDAKNGEAHKNLGIALIGAGKTSEAVEHLKEAQTAARSEGNKALVQAIENQLKNLSAAQDGGAVQNGGK